MSEPATDQTVDKVLNLAKDMGYNPDFEGEGKKTAEEFIKYGADIQKKQSSKIKDLIGKVEVMSSEFANVQKTFAETIDSQNARHADEIKREKERLESKFDTAVDEADPVEARRIRNEIDSLPEPKKETQHLTPDQEYFKQWKAGKEWMETDKKAQAEFQKALIDCKAEHGDGNTAKFELNYIEKVLKDKMPEKFGLKPAEKPPAGDVGEGKSATKITKELKVSDLNSEEKAQFNKWKRLSGKSFSEKSVLSALKAVRENKGVK